MLGWAHGREEDRSCRLEVRVRRLQLAVLVEDSDELAEVGVLPVTARPFALLEDRVDCPVGRGEVGDRDELRPVEVVARRLRSRRADEQVPLAELLRQVVDPVLDRAVEMPERREVLRLGNDVALRHQRHRLVHRCVDPLCALQLHALGALEEHEVAQCRLAERHQRQVDAGGIVPRRCGQVRAGEVRSRADRRQQVLHEREVEHLLGCDMRDHPSPAKHRLERVGGETLVFALLEGEGREQVLAHDPVLELRGLVEHVDQRLAVLDHERRLRRRLATARRDHLRQPAATRGRHLPVISVSLHERNGRGDSCGCDLGRRRGDYEAPR